MTALEPFPPADPEIHGRAEARTVRCPRCGKPAGTDCDMTRYPPDKPHLPRTFHLVRLDRAKKGW